MNVWLQEAAAARESTDGYKLDKNHTLAVNLFDEIDKYLKIPDEYQSPEQKAYVPQVRLNFDPSDFPLDDALPRALCAVCTVWCAAAWRLHQNEAIGSHCHLESN